MKPFRRYLVPLALLCSLHGAMAQTADPLSAAAWLAGCWAPEGEEAGSVEMWMAPAGGTMLGASRTVKGGKTVFHEFMLIQPNEQGALVFTALVEGQAATDFVAVPGTQGELVFENLAHDFPQRVMYRPVGPDRLAARIEGMDSGTLRGVDYPMQRIACETPSG